MIKNVVFEGVFVISVCTRSFQNQSILGQKYLTYRREEITETIQKRHAGCVLAEKVGIH